MEDASPKEVVQVVDVENATASEDASNLENNPPLLNLFKQLIGPNNKQNTILTDAQIIEILQKDFKIETNKLHELEVTIHLYIMKQFLKKWPGWNEFDKMLNNFKKKQTTVKTEDMREMLDMQYNKLKAYLMMILETAQPMAKEAAESATEKLKNNIKDTQDLSDVSLEIHCTRKQLNHLFFRHPNPEQNYSIFNTRIADPAMIVLKMPEYIGLFNWWDITLTIKCNILYFKRSSEHLISHRLINKKIPLSQNSAEMLPSCFQEKAVNYSRSLYKTTLVRMINSLSKYKEYEEVVKVIYSMLEDDIKDLPDEIKTPAAYRRHFSQYPYVRYLYTEVPDAKNDEMALKYDLQLEETITPMYQIYIGKAEPELHGDDKTQIQVECRLCNIKYSGPKLLESLKQHILVDHWSEPDWQCSNCRETISMVCLADNRWRHECSK